MEKRFCVKGWNAEKRIFLLIQNRIIQKLLTRREE